MPASLTTLRRLVTALLVVMIGGFLLIIVLFALRLTEPPSFIPPETVALPEGETLIGASFSAGLMILVTSDLAGVHRIHLIPDGTTEIRQTIDVLHSAD